MKHSLFQSEILISEANFLRHFPSRSGYSYFLVDPPAGSEERATEALESALGPFGLDVTSTAQRLRDYNAVQNTYLSTFQTLGGLGLLLGTLGLGIILVRNIMERRGELAALRAFGFRRVRLALMVLAENVFLLGFGISLGTVSALAAIAPMVLGEGSSLPWASLLLTLAVVFLVGMLASLAGVLGTLRVALLPALKAEH
jgi:ABC-type antimicrobial peptide transport system permease subunit